MTSCPRLLPPNNGIIVGGNSPPTHVGATVEFQCNLGYNFEAEASTVRAVCKCTGEWQYTPVKPYCKREIKSPHLILQIGKFVVCSFSVWTSSSITSAGRIRSSQKSTRSGKSGYLQMPQGIWFGWNSNCCLSSGRLLVPCKENSSSARMRR